MFAIMAERAHVLHGRMDRQVSCGEALSFDVMFAESRLSNMVVCGSCTGEPEVRRAAAPVAAPKPLPSTGEARKRGRQPGSQRCLQCGKIRVLNARGNCGMC